MNLLVIAAQSYEDFYDMMYEIFAGKFAGIVLLGMVVISLVCQIRVKTTFSKYNKVRTVNGMTADMVARQILDMNGLYNIQIVRVSGNLTEHYDPRSCTVALSDSTYGNATVGAIGVAAHECGHAIQHNKNYAPIKLRQALYPVVSFCSNTWIWILLIGSML